MRGLVAVAVLVSLAFAGCTAKTDTSASQSVTVASTKASVAGAGSTGSSTAAASGSTAGSSQTTGASTGTGAAPSGKANGPPTATLTSRNATGSIPFNVTFSLGGHDPDGDALSYNITFGDGSAPVTGTTLPANVTHQYALVGNFSAVLEVSDGTHAANATLLVKALAAAGEAVVLPGHDPLCQRPKVLLTAQGYYDDDRGGSPGFGAPSLPAGGLLTSDGAWVYKETNGIPGLQIDIRPGVNPVLGGSSDIDSLAAKYNCVGGDELQF